MIEVAIISMIEVTIISMMYVFFSANQDPIGTIMGPGLASAGIIIVKTCTHIILYPIIFESTTCIHFSNVVYDHIVHMLGTLFTVMEIG